MPDVFGGELVASDDQLETDDDSSHALERNVSIGRGVLANIRRRGLTRVISDTCLGSLTPQSAALRKLAAIGPRQMPNTIAGTENKVC